MEKSNLKKVAITGGIATGKTTLLRLVKKMGFPTLSCDEVVKKLYEKQSVLEKLRKFLPEEVFTPEKKVNSRKLLSLILKDKTVKKRIEDLIHPEVKKEVVTFFKEAEKKGAKVLFVEVPLLFEVGWEHLFDEVWLITCSEELQKKRIFERGEVGEFLMQLASFQMPLKEKLKRLKSLKNYRIFSSEKPVLQLEKNLKSILKEYLEDKFPLP